MWNLSLIYYNKLGKKLTLHFVVCGRGGRPDNIGCKACWCTWQKILLLWWWFRFGVCACVGLQSVWRSVRNRQWGKNVCSYLWVFFSIIKNRTPRSTSYPVIWLLYPSKRMCRGNGWQSLWLIWENRLPGWRILPAWEGRILGMWSRWHIRAGRW